MLVEKYIVIGIKYPKDVVTNIIKIPTYNSIIDNVNFIKEPKNDIFVDGFVGPYTKKSDAFKRIENIKNNVSDIMYWSILPVVVEVTFNEARLLKLKKLRNKLK